ncbi:NADH:flavin oxidoreductase/NADH oxidase [Actinokineospora auranticolor]|uniref:2,4-dienoyl-CoA reductase-like NADH-dependent reductase (Old Yellow Enzyme family) n=1 Tax=Actinokineospora auranticolor TaxID=155976 RepID=A0A2S6GRI0_9PSEU|nr:NADH:flavin oxidoreductase/NADH oxidase [Actinokineospora auranticolor]PPK67810.1 2,4-dienoyl-CoA reductase-like NADH-dependent reductase (Old Yellow Enzyme family) [Actinokineospora auranticolor]
MSLLFSPLTLRSTTLPNRIAVSPMCQYSATDGLPDNWHLVHLGSRAVGGAGLVIAEATAVEPIGRIAPQDTGIWSARHVQAWRPITEFIRSQGSVPGIQLAHAGRKGSTYSPWVERSGGVADEDGGWTPVGPTDEPFTPEYRVPQALSAAEIEALVDTWAQAARFAVEAGFEVVEVHAAHGYLLHEFLSPLTNTRTDAYGGDAARRLAFPLAVVRAVRAAVGPDLPVFVRISATDWTDGGLTVDDSVEISRALAAAGADLVDVSSGGNVADARITTGPGYQVPFADAIRRKAEVATAAVGEITEAHQAERVLADGSADLVLLGRELLRDPYWPHRAAAALGVGATPPVQYARAL